MRAPPKTLAKRKGKLPVQLTKGQVVMIAGGVALLLYLILTIVSAVFLFQAQSMDSEKEAIEITLNCTQSNSSFSREYVQERLTHVIGTTIRIIFWTWQVIIFVLSLMVYIVYTIAGWQESHTLGRAWCFVIGVLTILNFVPCSYIFTFGDVTVMEKVAYWAMLGVVLAFRIADTAVMLLLLKEVKRKKALGEVKPNFPLAETPGPSPLPTISSPQMDAVNNVKVEPGVTSDPNQKLTSDPNQKGGNPPGSPPSDPPV